MFTGDLKKGDEYSKLKRSISVSVLNYNMFGCEEYHSEFNIMEQHRHEILTDLFSMHFYELQKIPALTESNSRTDNRLLWLQLIKANKKEAFDMLQQTGNTLIQKGVRSIVELNEDIKMQELIRMREKRELDELSALNSAMRKGLAKGLEQGRAEGRAEGMAKGVEKGRAELKELLIAKLRREGRSEKEIADLLDGIV